MTTPRQEITNLPRINSIALGMSAPLAEFLSRSIATGEIDVAVRQLLEAHQRNRSLRLGDIIAVVGKHYGIERATLCGTTRTKHLSLPREMVAYLARLLTDRSLSQIGRTMQRHETAIHYQVEKMRERLVVDAAIAREAEYLVGKCWESAT